MNMARYEQETIINFNEEEKTAGIYTHNKVLRQKLAALARDRQSLQDPEGMRNRVPDG